MQFARLHEIPRADREADRARSPSGCETARLVVIVGLPRSGTTWLAKIFDSHPDTSYCHEPDNRGGLRGVPLVPGRESSLQFDGAVQSFAQQLMTNRSVHVLGKLPLFPKRDESHLRFLLRRAEVMVAKAVSRATRGSSVSLRLWRDSPVVVWKSIESTTRLGLLARALPIARFLHVVRHPCGWANSVMRGTSMGMFGNTRATWDDEGQFRALQAASDALVPGVDYAQVSSLSPTEKLAWLWTARNEKAFHDTRGLENVLRIRYEDVCAAPEKLGRDMFAAAGLQWCRESEAFVRLSTTRATDAYYSVFKDPMRAAVDWQARMTPDAVQSVMNVARNSSIWRWYSEGATGLSTMSVASPTAPATDHPCRIRMHGA